MRDTTPHSPAEILRRLASVCLAVSPGLAILLAFLALVQRDEGLMRGAWICAAVFLALFVTRRRWRATSPEADAAHAGPPPARTAAAPTGSAGSAASTSDTPPSPPPSRPRPRVLLLDASLAGPGGNSSRLLDAFTTHLSAHAQVERVALTGPGAVTFATLEPALRAADAFVFATGTHWDSWSSALQKFLEDATPAEATDLWLGKPAAVLVTEHSVGGKAVLSRLQGVLLTLGCALPPLSGLVLSKAAQLARIHARDTQASGDFWAVDDLGIVAHNLLAGARLPRSSWRAWPVDRHLYRQPWLQTEAPGE